MTTDAILSPGSAPLRPALARAFSRAIAAAEAFRGATAPNPPVGCIVLDAADRILAEAAHERAGTAHAEAKALAACRASGILELVHTVVVTLEPCNHFGRTPPCTDAIVATPAKAVWFGTADPNPAVAGGGAARLRAAGLEVHALAQCAEDGDLLRRCRDLIAPFAKRAMTGRPWVTVKQALDAKGSMIPPPGRKTFTSPAALSFAHRLRKRADALATGSGTILADNPDFTVRRVPDFPDKQRRLVIFDRRGRVPEAYRAAARGRGFDVWVERDMIEALDRLGGIGVLEVLLEAGPALTSTWLEAGLWDEHVVIEQGIGADAVEIVRSHTAADGQVRRIAPTLDDRAWAAHL